MKQKTLAQTREIIGAQKIISFLVGWMKFNFTATDSPQMRISCFWSRILKIPSILNVFRYFW